jgi:hypothetical protein
MTNWLECELTFKSFLPLRLEVGMMFFRKLSPGTPKEQIELFALDKPVQNADEFMKWNGTPVELFITDASGDVIASHDEIGWFDEGDHSDELTDITLEHLNIILNNYQGNLDVGIEDDGVSILDGKVIIRYVQEMYEEDDDNMCSHCNGTGEGQYDGSRCSVCGGSGEGDVDYEPDYDPDDDYDRDDDYDVESKEWGGMDI